MIGDLISRSALIKAFDPEHYFDWYTPSIIETINEQPTVDAKPVIRGEWIEDRMDYICSQCKTRFDDDLTWIKGEDELPNFCPECGADMRGGLNER